MEQIKSDVKRHKRIFSGDTETSHITTHVEENTNSFTRSFTASLKIAADGKEDTRQSSSSAHRRTSNSKANVSRSRIASPRKSYKQTAEDAIDLAHNLSRISIHEQQPIVNITLMPPSNVLPGAPTTAHHDPPFEQPTATNPPSTLAPPSYPSTSIRITTNEDLNRFVSSSTASGTTLTASSVPSFTKHAGPAHIRTIAPTDLPSLPERFGDMMFDKVMMKWVKSTAKATMGSERSGTSHAGEVSDDPFGDIESLRDDSRTDREDHNLGQEEDDREGPGHPAEMSIIEEQSEIEDEEELELSNFSTDASAHIVNVMTGVDTDDYNDETTDSEDENDQLHTITQAHQHQVGGGINEINDFDSEFDESSPSRMNSVHSIHDIPIPSSNARGPAATQFLSVHTHTQVVTTTFSTPSRGNVGPVANSMTPVIRSALKSNSATPTSALKNSDRRHYQTPLHRTSHHRSVSFSDGKRDGPIQGE